MKSGKERGNSARSPFCCPYEHFFKKSISHIFSKTLLNFQVAVITGGFWYHGIWSDCCQLLVITNYIVLLCQARLTRVRTVMAT